jgi:hypothetical protein
VWASAIRSEACRRDGRRRLRRRGAVGGSVFALLAWAVLTGEPLGGPLAFPFLILVGLIASTFAVAAVLFPVSAFTEWICLSRSGALRVRRRERALHGNGVPGVSPREPFAPGRRDDGREPGAEMPQPQRV